MKQKARHTVKDPSTASVSPDLQKDMNYLQALFSNSSDVIFFQFDSAFNRKMMLVYIGNLVDIDIINRDVITPLTGTAQALAHQGNTVSHTQITSCIKVSNIGNGRRISQAVNGLLDGAAVLFMDGCRSAYLIPVNNRKERSIAEPPSENVTIGPREGFVENIHTNRSMIRRKIKNRNLVFESITLGKQSNTMVDILYLKGIANDKILSIVKRRLNKIDIDAVLDTCTIQELIRDAPYSPFNTVGITERPDVLAAKLLEGRIGILCDGTPTVLTVPFLFIENFQSNEDYYRNYIASTINRMIRFVAFFLTIFVPGLYVALVSHHHDMIPRRLLFSIISARTGVPFPSVFELLIMIFVFEMLRESGLRLPRGLGQAVSIVGALVLGQAAVEAKFISAPVVIIIAITAIASFIFYNMNSLVMVSRIIVLILAAYFGLVGVIIALIALVLHIVSLRSFGVPYSTNLGSFQGQEIKDTIMRAPWWFMRLRPRGISGKNVRRERPKR